LIENLRKEITKKFKKYLITPLVGLEALCVIYYRNRVSILWTSQRKVKRVFRNIAHILIFSS